VAWLSSTEDEMRGCGAEVAKGGLACPERSVSSGHVDPNAMRLSRTTLTWTATDGVYSGTV